MARAIRALLAGVVVLTAGSCGQEPAGGPAGGKQPAATLPAAPAGKPTAEQIVRQVAEFYRQVPGFHVDFTLTFEIRGPAGNEKMSAESSVVAQRPNRIAMRQKQGAQGVDVICDGKELYLYVPALSQYTQAKAPKSFGELGKDPVIAGFSGGGPLVLALLNDNPQQALMAGVKSASYAGRQAVDGVQAHHVKFTQEEFDWEVWVDAGKEPLVLRQVVDMTKALEAAGQVPKGSKLLRTETYKNWRLGAKPSSEAFVFKAPPQAKKVDDFFSRGEEPEVSPLVGKPAPDIQLKLLDGGSFELKKEQGNNVVILDFWATWCGPCVREMPLVAEIADRYRAKGVRLYAINQREDPETIRKFLQSQKLNVTVALDSEGAAGDSYGVQGIPTLVLVDKKGIVQSVHVGFSPRITSVLEQELDALLAGKDLGAEPPAEAKDSPAKPPAEKTNSP